MVCVKAWHPKEALHPHDVCLNRPPHAHAMLRSPCDGATGRYWPPPSRGILLHHRRGPEPWCCGMRYPAGPLSGCGVAPTAARHAGLPGTSPGHLYLGASSPARPWFWPPPAVFRRRTQARYPRLGDWNGPGPRPATPAWGSGPVPARGPRPATPLVWGGLDRSLHALSALGDAGPRPATPPRGGTGTARPPPSPEGARPCPATPSWELGRSLSALSAPAATLDPPSDPLCGDWPDGPRRRWRGSPPQGPAQLVRRVSGFTPLAQPLYGHT